MVTDQNTFQQTTKSQQVWDAKRYAREAGFVVNIGQDVFAWLQPKAHERILDVGCGAGDLTLKLARQCADVVAIDASVEQIELAKQASLNASVMNASQLPFDNEFDAVFSNATYHWVSDLNGAVKSVWKALKPGGRFIAECGGAGNIQFILDALQRVFAKHGLEFAEYMPWHFREADEWIQTLQRQGFIDIEHLHYERPTPTGRDITDWLELMAGNFLNSHTDDFKQVLLKELRIELEPKLFDADKGWWIDYKRLRIKAVKPSS